jgi:chemotaxis protein methyltransferase CheR
MTAPHRSAVTVLDPDLHSRYLGLIEQQLGLRLTPQQAQALPLAVSHVLSKSGHATPGELYATLATTEDRTLMDLLGADLVIGETHFFRIAPQIEALRAAVLPAIMARRAGTRRLSMWSAGCSTGEEAYTLAMLAREVLPASNPWHVQLFGTDLSYRAIAAAREALYSEWSFRETPEWVRTRWFTPEGARLRLNESIKRMVRFSELNLMDDAFPSPGAAGTGFDLILCRNVTIYFSHDTSQRLYRRFAEALSPGGWLILGPSDPVPNQPTWLEPVSIGGAIVWRRPTEPGPVEIRGTATLTPEYRPTPAAPVARTIRSSGAAARPGVGPRHLARPDPTPARPAADLQAHLLLGLKHLEAGAVDEAITSLRRAAYVDGNHSLTQYSLGRAYLQAHDAPRAHAAFNRARQLLAAGSADQVVEVGGDMTIEELRFAVEAHLAALGGGGEL